MSAPREPIFANSWETPDGALRPYWPLLAAVCLVLAYDARLVAMHGLGLDGDGTGLFYPVEYALGRALSQGTLPFWAPEIQAGFPLLAGLQPGALYPLNLLACGVLPTPIAHNALLVGHHCLGLLFTFWWGRTLGLSRHASSWMAVAFSLTSPLIGFHVPFIEAFTWVPLLFALAERWARRRSRWVIGAAAAVQAFQWLAGFPQIALYTVLATHVYLCGRVCTEPLQWATRARRVLVWSAAALVGLLLAAPQLLPTYELSAFSIRAGGISGSMAGEKSLFPAALITAVLPSWRRFFEGAGLGEGAYIGVLPAVLGLAALVVRPRARWVLPLLTMSGMALVLACGRFSPLFPIVRHVPGLAYFRVPSRFLLFTQFGLITFFGLGWDIAGGACPIRFRNAVRRLLQTVAALGLMSVILGHPLLLWLRPRLIAWAEQVTQRYILTDPYHLQSPSYYHDKIAYLYAALIDAVSLQHADVVLPLGIAVVAWVVWQWGGEDPHHLRRRQALCGGLIALDVVVLAGGLRGTTAASWVTGDPPAARFVRQEIGSALCRTFWLEDGKAVGGQRLRLLPANYNLIAGVPSTGLYGALGVQAYYNLMGRLGTVNLAFGNRPVRPEDVAHDRALLDLLNVCYVLSRQPLTGFTPLARFGDVTVYRNEQAAPRAFLVDQVEIVPSTDAALAWIKAHPEHLRETAVLEEPLPITLEPGAARTATVDVTDYRASDVSLAVTTAAPVLLVMTDTYYPGWSALIDDQPTHIYRTHAVFRAVLVPPGAHRVRFTYTPTTFWQGLVVAAVAAAIGLVASAIAFRETQ